MRKLTTFLWLTLAVLLFSAGESFALPPCSRDETHNWHNCFGTFTHGPSSDWAGEKYVGEFKNGGFHGQGTYSSADGGIYVGEFNNNEFHGRGVYTHGPSTEAAGDKYVGEFKNSRFHGQGTYTYADGSVLEGIWDNGEFQYARKVSPPVTKSDPDEAVSASSGSGFAVSSDGHVITNHHVIDGCQKILIHHRGKSIPATILTYDPVNDLALLQGDFRPSTVFALSKEKPELLQDIYVAGYPFGQEISTSVKVTKGIISSLTGIRNNFSNIQIDAALQPGNSGGPIIDANGNIVGVAVAKLDFKKALETWGVIPENTNFGIKATVVRNLLESNDVTLPNPNTKPLSKSELGKMITDGTYYLSCWMTYAQIEMLRSKKVLFQTLD